MKAVGMWLAAVMAAGVAGAGPITTQTAAAPLGGDLLVELSADCESSNGRWHYLWEIKSVSASGTLLSARDPDNGVGLTFLGREFAAGGYTLSRGSVAGAAGTIALEAVLQLSGEPTTRTIQRRVSLGEPCVAEQLPACVQARGPYAHTFDAATGRVTVRVDGPPPCQVNNALLMQFYEGPGESSIASMTASTFSPTKVRSVLYLDRLPCDNELRLEIDSRVVGSDSQDLGTCLAASFLRTDTCTGVKVDLSNAAEAKLSVDFMVARSGRDETESWRFHLAPGQSSSVFVRAVGDPPAAGLRFYVNNNWVADRAWTKPSSCVGHDLPPVRTPPTATPTGRPLPPIRG